MTLHLLKLCVGAESVQDLLDWQISPRAQGPDGRPWHVTRMWPKQDSAVLDGGSMYWVFKGVVLARQRIHSLHEVTGGDGIRRCGISLDPKVVRTEPQPRRPFQGWRYLKPTDAPRDLRAPRAGDDELPPGLAEGLAEFGWR